MHSSAIPNSTLQKNKEAKYVILYTTNPVEQDAYIQACNAKGYIVVKAETLVDAAFINTMEMKWENVHFKRVDADITDNLIDEQDKSISVLTKEEEDRLKEIFDTQKHELHATIEIKGLSPDAPPVTATRPEFMRRMKDMASAGGGMSAFYANMPDEVTLTVNANHKVYQKILSDADADNVHKQVHNLTDLALLSQGLLKGNKLTEYINRNIEMMTAEQKSSLIIEV